jgi:hypothetical protein
MGIVGGPAAGLVAKCNQVSKVWPFALLRRHNSVKRQKSKVQTKSNAEKQSQQLLERGSVTHKMEVMDSSSVDAR